jgi:hypothetical protein
MGAFLSSHLFSGLAVCEVISIEVVLDYEEMGERELVILNTFSEAGNFASFKFLGFSVSFTRGGALVKEVPRGARFYMPRGVLWGNIYISQRLGKDLFNRLFF